METSAVSTYAWTVNTTLPPTVIRDLLDKFRPFRIEVNFSTGFSTKEFLDKTAYATSEPLAKIHYFKHLLPLMNGRKVLDIGSHLGYYGYFLLHAGIASYAGIESDKRIHHCAQVIKSISIDNTSALDFYRLDFSDANSLGVLSQSAPFDFILSLASINNTENFLNYLDHLTSLSSDRATVVMECLVIDSEESLCLFQKDGYLGDKSLRWIFSESFLDEYFLGMGFSAGKKNLDWSNDATIGFGRKKILKEYNRHQTISRRKHAD